MLVVRVAVGWGPLAIRKLQAPSGSTGAAGRPVDDGAGQVVAQVDPAVLAVVTVVVPWIRIEHPVACGRCAEARDRSRGQDATVPRGPEAAGHRAI